MTERVRVREIDDNEGNRLPRIVTPYADRIGVGGGLAAGQMVLLSAG
ncbi:hypothetical protein [Microtetraspora malaysiensis]